MLLLNFFIRHKRLCRYEAAWQALKFNAAKSGNRSLLDDMDSLEVFYRLGYFGEMEDLINVKA